MLMRLSLGMNSPHEYGDEGQYLVVYAIVKWVYHHNKTNL
jgi:hypothetical protein